MCLGTTGTRPYATILLSREEIQRFALNAGEGACATLQLHGSARGKDLRWGHGQAAHGTMERGTGDRALKLRANICWNSVAPRVYWR